MKKSLFLALLLAFTGTELASAQDVTDQNEQTAAEETPAETESKLTDGELAYIAWAKELLNSMSPQTGRIQLPGGFATLNVPEGYYYLPPEDAKRVLEEAWGNPPSGQTNLGMLFPEGQDAFTENSWAVEIDFEAEGYVKDDDADDIDYDDLLKQMKKDVASTNPDRSAQGYEEIELIGWAAEPYYDKETKKLYWAKEFRFGEQETNTLNYNIRVLGRRGYLLMNFIAGMDQLEEIDARKGEVLAMAAFNNGDKYRDFDPEIDKVAAYGIGGLIAGKVLLKTGILTTALLFFKKFFIIILAALGGLFAKIFRRNKSEV